MTDALKITGDDITNATIEMGQRAHIEAAGTNSRDHGFHDDWPAEGYPTVTATGKPASDVPASWVEEHKMHLRRAITEKLALIHEEISEALGEIRSGKDPLHIYFSHTEKIKNGDGVVVSEIIKYYNQQSYDEQGAPLYKPEGFLVELADASIRISDLVFLVEGEDEYVEADRVKREFNASREYKHGRKF